MANGERETNDLLVIRGRRDREIPPEMRSKLQDFINALRLDGVEVEVNPDEVEDILRSRGVSPLGVILTRAITVAEWGEETRHGILLKRD